MANDLFDTTIPQPHKTAVRERLLALAAGTALDYQRAYGLTRDISNRPANWQANVRDELHRLRDKGHFTHRGTGTGMIYTRTDR